MFEDHEMKVLEYLVEKHKDLIKNYPASLVDSDDPNQFSDTEIPIKNPNFSLDLAIEVARRLLNDGKIPYIVAFIEENNQEDAETYRHFSPLLYQNQVVWWCHHVCCSGDMTYDPFLGKPIPIEQYSEFAFGEKISMSIAFDADEIIKLINSKKTNYSIQNVKKVHNPASMRFQRKFQMRIPIISGEDYQIISKNGVIETFDYNELSN